MFHSSDNSSYPDKTGTPRYASVEMLESIRLFERPLRLVAHLCGSRVHDLFNGNTTFVKHLSKCGFQRIQINPTSVNDFHMNIDSKDDSKDEMKNDKNDMNGTLATQLKRQVPLLRRVMLETPEIEYIIQLNDETLPLWNELSKDYPPSNMSCLYDSSLGRGYAISSFPPPPSIHESPKGCGYAGGINVTNINDVLHSIKNVAGNAPVWIDMESSLRKVLDNGQDIFDIDKCTECINIATRCMLD